MSKMNRFAIALLLSQPLVVSAGGAFAFSFVDGPSSAGMNIADPEEWSDNLSDQMSRVWSAPTPDYSNTLLLPDAGQASESSTPAPLPAPFQGRVGRQ